MAKPKDFDNTWLGCMGEGSAQLFDKKNKLIGYCLDTPNCTAYAMAINPQISTAKGILGTKKRKELESRFWFVLKDASVHSGKVKFL